MQPFTSMEDKISPVSEYSHPPPYVFGKGEKKKSQKERSARPRRHSKCVGVTGDIREFHWSSTVLGEVLLHA